MNPKLNEKQIAKVNSIDSALKDALERIQAVKRELLPSDGLVWNPSFKKMLHAQEIVIEQMQKMNAAIRQLKKDANL
jgi:hypothetical protein